MISYYLIFTLCSVLTNDCKEMKIKTESRKACFNSIPTVTQLYTDGGKWRVLEPVVCETEAQ